MVQSKTNKNRWEDGDHVTDFNPFTQKDDKAYPQTRWIDVLQNDFAARADWCVQPYSKANHAPVVKLSHANVLSAKPGGTVKLDGKASDPDGNSLTYKWWQYFEVDTYPGNVVIKDSTKAAGELEVPADVKSGETIHIILEVSDSGQPKLTRYQRVMITAR